MSGTATGRRRKRKAKLRAWFAALMAMAAAPALAQGAVSGAGKTASSSDGRTSSSVGAAVRAAPASQQLMNRAVEACADFADTYESSLAAVEGFTRNPAGWLVASADGATVGVVGVTEEADDGYYEGRCEIVIEGPAPWFKGWAETRHAEWLAWGFALDTANSGVKADMTWLVAGDFFNTVGIGYRTTGGYGRHVMTWSE